MEGSWKSHWISFLDFCVNHEMNRKPHILESKKITEACNTKRSSKFVRGYGVLHCVLRNLMSLFIKIISLYNPIHFFAILYPASLANLVVEVRTRHSHQILLAISFHLVSWLTAGLSVAFDDQGSRAPHSKFWRVQWRISLSRINVSFTAGIYHYACT